jgi:hypothetical protein
VFPDDALLLAVVVPPLLLAGLTCEWGSAAHGSFPVLAFAGGWTVAGFQGWTPAVVFPDEVLLLLVVVPPLLLAVPTGTPGILTQLPHEVPVGTVALCCAKSFQKSAHCWA